MSTLVSAQLDGIDLVIEAAPETAPVAHAPVDPSLVPTGVPLGDEEPPLKARAAQLEQAVKIAGRLAEHVKSEVVERQGPELAEVTVKLNLGFNAEGKVAIFAKASGSASLEVALKWARPAPPK